MPSAERTGLVSRAGRNGRTNLGVVERITSAAAGGALVFAGLRRSRGASESAGTDPAETGDGRARAARHWGGRVPMLLGGGYLVYRGLSGRCLVSEKLGIRRGARGGVEAGTAVTIERPVSEVYRYWSDLENLPTFMEHLESVRLKADGRSHWVAKGPAGMRVEWDAEVTERRENECIAWRTLTGSEIENEGRVDFRPTPDGSGTEVRVQMTYHPKAGAVGAVMAKVLGEEPNLQIKDDLRRFRQILETGEVSTTAGQPSGREGGAA